MGRYRFGEIEGVTSPGHRECAGPGVRLADKDPAHVRKRALDERAGTLVCPPICGLELLDVLAFSDALVSASSQARRVAAITWRLDRARGIYEQRIELGVV